MSDIHHSSQLIFLTISQWGARSFDRSVSRDLNEEKQAAENASRVNKYLMAAADKELKAIARVGRQARDLIEAKTLPWDDAGNRLVANLELFSLLGELRTIEMAFNGAVESFLTEYPRLKTESMQALGTMAKASDYPSDAEVRTKFGMRTSLSPVPDGYADARTGLSPLEIKALNEQYASQVTAQFENAQEAAFTQLRSNIERMAERLTPTDEGKNKAFTYTMVDNLRATVHLMKGLNIFNNADLTSLATDIETRLCHYDATDLRNSIQASSNTKHAADQILSRMKSFGL